tara:strand:+ start:36 stop:317 length:282 start_codon:yes stop_codon:yes gene_type:complete
MKYKNKQGVELNIKDMTEVGRIGGAMDLVQEVVHEAIKILSSYNRFDARSAEWALHRGKTFLEENFDIDDEYKASCGVCNRKDNTCGCRKDDE